MINTKPEAMMTRPSAIKNQPNILRVKRLIIRFAERKRRGPGLPETLLKAGVFAPSLLVMCLTIGRLATPLKLLLPPRQTLGACPHMERHNRIVKDQAEYEVNVDKI